MAGVQVFTSLAWSDLLFMAEGASRTVVLTLWSALLGTALGLVVGLARASAPLPLVAVLGGYIDPRVAACRC